MKNFVALYDACVLYPAPLRDLLMHLALTDLYQAKWTNLIHDEWIRNLLINRPEMNTTAAQCLDNRMPQRAAAIATLAALIWHNVQSGEIKNYFFAEGLPSI